MPLRNIAPNHTQYEAIKSAFALVIEELAETHPASEISIEVKEAVVTALLDLAEAGQSDPVALARYGVSRGQAALRQ